MKEFAAAVFRQYGAARFASRSAKGNPGAGGLAFTSGCAVAPVDPYPAPCRDAHRLAAAQKRSTVSRS